MVLIQMRKTNYISLILKLNNSSVCIGDITHKYFNQTDSVITTIFMFPKGLYQVLDGLTSSDEWRDSYRIRQKRRSIICNRKTKR